jgi:hypothetical protein
MIVHRPPERIVRDQQALCGLGGNRRCRVRPAAENRHFPECSAWPFLVHQVQATTTTSHNSYSSGHDDEEPGRSAAGGVEDLTRVIPALDCAGGDGRGRSGRERREQGQAPERDGIDHTIT